ncbi:MAG: SAM-dependent methyltransferase, partial [Lachnospiraceae bacterium]|nr:SAM-dependent methyltransferase [Lachnospiraceae bacterium]
DMTLVFGPMYHLFSFEDKLKALSEAKRVTRRGGYILVAYVMNEYGVITFAFKEGNIRSCMDKNMLTEDFHCVTKPEDLYDYVRLEDIERLHAAAQLDRVKIIAADGAANYIRPTLKEMDDQTFSLFMEYHLATYERPELLGASAHTVDILQKR